MEKKNTSIKQKEIEKKLYEYYQQTVEERMKKEISVDANKVTLENLKKKISIYKEQTDELALFTPKLNTESEKRKKEKWIREKCQLEDSLEQMRKEIDSLPVLETKDGKNFEEENPKLEKLKMLQVQEMERKRIASELHDTAAQSLIAVYNKMDLCNSLIDVDSVRAKLEIQTTQKYIKDILSEIRETIYNLRPMSFDDIGLDTTLSQMVEKIKCQSGLKVTIENQQILEELVSDSLVKLTLFRIIHEACMNVVKHAQATKILVVFNYKDNILNIMIEDDGTGFDVTLMEKKQERDNSGYGISMMKERVYLLSGSMEIDSKIDVGTKIIIKIPLLEED